MSNHLRFSKATGAGNDFVILDGRQRPFPLDRGRLAQTLCNRHFGVGADGMLVVDPSETAAFTMSYYNADGSYGGMCGNGGRCIAKYACTHGLAGRQMVFEALGHLYKAEVLATSVKLRMKDPSGLRHVTHLSAVGERFDGHFVDTGSPHFVIFVEHLEAFDVERVGRALRHHQAFHPAGTNVNFVKSAGGGLELRTYERGVERETLACGTGSVAAAIVALATLPIRPPVSVRVQSGEILRVHARESKDVYTDVFLEGGAEILFSGELLYDEASGSISGPTAAASGGET